jgi:hypothetical protein
MLVTLGFDAVFVTLDLVSSRITALYRSDHAILTVV